MERKSTATPARIMDTKTYSVATTMLESPGKSTMKPKRRKRLKSTPRFSGSATKRSTVCIVSLQVDLSSNAVFCAQIGSVSWPASEKPRRKLKS
jgi:hypothetical protein